jgi:hypothetical protein
MIVKRGRCEKEDKYNVVGQGISVELAVQSARLEASCHATRIPLISVLRPLFTA